MGAPGKYWRKGLTIVEVMAMFPDEKSAHDWWVKTRWPGGVACVHCGSVNVQTKARHPSQPFRCRDCRSFFSVKTGTCLQSSNLSLRIWAIAVYLMNSNCKGISSLKLHRELGITQRSAWFLLHRIREAFDEQQGFLEGPVEVDEAYIGGREKNKHYDRKLKGAQGGSGKAPVVGMKDRKTNRVVAAVISETSLRRLQTFVHCHAALHKGAKVYTDEHASYVGLPNHSSVKHTQKCYVRGDVHTNGIESSWAMLKRGYYGTYHWMSRKHLQRYVNEFSGRHNLRPLDTIEQMRTTVAGMEGKRLRYCDLVG